MAAVQLSVVPPPLPSSWTPSEPSGKSTSRELIRKSISENFLTAATALVERKLLPVGAAYLAHVRRTVRDLSFEEHDKLEEEHNRLRGLNGSNEIVDDLGVGDEVEGEELKLLDSKEWKVTPSFINFS